MKYFIISLLLVIMSCAPRMVAPDNNRYIEIHTTEDIYYVHIDKLYITSEADKHFKYNTYREMMLAVADITSQDATKNWK